MQKAMLPLSAPISPGDTYLLVRRVDRGYVVEATLGEDPAPEKTIRLIRKSKGKPDVSFELEGVSEAPQVGLRQVGPGVMAMNSTAGAATYAFEDRESLVAFVRERLIVG